MPHGSDLSQTKRAQIWFNLQQTGIAKLYGVSEATVRRIHHSGAIVGSLEHYQMKRIGKCGQNDCSHLELHLS